MDIVRATILEVGIDDTVWPEIVLAMTYVKNLQPTCAVEGNISPTEMQNQALPDVQHLYILSSNIYVFLHKEKQSLKSAKWEARTFKKKLVGFDGHTIYRVYIEGQNKFIQVKNLKIFEDITSKSTTTLPNFEGKPTFNRVQIPDKQGPSDESSNSEKKKVKPKKLLQKLSKT